MVKKRVMAVRLNFHSGIHIGGGLSNDYSRSEGILRSDTISGALASAYAQMHDGKDVLKFLDTFILSSAFPFYKERYFFPKPLIRLPLDNDYIFEKGLAKSIKKVQFIEKDVFENIINREKLFPEKEHFNDAFWFNDTSNNPVIIKSELQQRVNVPRDGGANALPYFVEKLFFAEGAGLFFILEAIQDATASIIECMNYLAHRGFGTDKSVGNGGFDYKISHFDLNLPDDANKQMLLSLWCPQEAEIDKNFLGGSSYQIVRRGGYMAGSSHEKFQHLRKKSVYMFSECSVFPYRKIAGKICDIVPDWNDPLMHPVYRDGRCFSLPVKTN